MRAEAWIFVVLLVAFLGGCALKVAAYNECRGAGFSVLYCLRR